MTSGARHQLITLQRGTAAADAYNEETLTWSELSREWAAFNPGRGDERRQAAMEQGQAAGTFTVLDNAVTRTFRVKDRIIDADGNEWDVTDNSPGRSCGERDITAVRATI